MSGPAPFVTRHIWHESIKESGIVDDMSGLEVCGLIAVAIGAVMFGTWAANEMLMQWNDVYDRENGLGR